MSISYQRVMIISGIDNRGLISMDEIIICRHCGKPEDYGKMRWLNGVCSCRSCYKSQWEDTNHEVYIWRDLDGKRPTMEEYESQKEKRNK